MRRALATSACFVLLLAATLAPKLVSGSMSWRDDDQRLAGVMAALLRKEGLRTRIVASEQGPKVIASRGACRLLARSGYDWPVLRDVFAADALAYGPVRYGYRGDWTPLPPRRARLLLDRTVQLAEASVRNPAARPATIALAQTAGCRGIAAPLASLHVAITRSPAEDAVAPNAID